LFFGFFGVCFVSYCPDDMKNDDALSIQTRDKRNTKLTTKIGVALCHSQDEEQVVFGGEGLNRQYSTADTADFDSALDKVRQRFFLQYQFILLNMMIILPRQARDKHRERSTQREMMRFLNSRGPGSQAKS
jgi:hypothetical protein